MSPPTVSRDLANSEEAPRRHIDVFADVGMSEHVVGQMFYPHSISVTKGAASFKGLFNAVECGPFVMAELDYNVAMTMEVPDIDGYHLNMALGGSLASTTDLGTVRSAPGMAVLYRAGSGAVLRTDSGATFKMFALKIDSRALENTMCGLLGRAPDRELIRFTADLDITSGDGLRWWNLLSSVREQWTDNRLLNNPLVAAPLFQSILAGLLLAARHQYSERLHEDPARVVPGSVRLAEDFILQRLAEPLTVGEIAHHVNLSMRALQRGFVQYLGKTPSQYIRAKRLDRVHADLAMSDPSAIRVADIATRWGFTHLGALRASTAPYTASHRARPSVLEPNLG